MAAREDWELSVSKRYLASEYFGLNLLSHPSLTGLNHHIIHFSHRFGHPRRGCVFPSFPLISQLTPESWCERGQMTSHDFGSLANNKNSAAGEINFSPGCVISSSAETLF